MFERLSFLVGGRETFCELIQDGYDSPRERSDMREDPGCRLSGRALAQKERPTLRPFSLGGV
jgi:hypothetical protein